MAPPREFVYFFPFEPCIRENALMQNDAKPLSSFFYSRALTFALIVVGISSLVHLPRAPYPLIVLTYYRQSCFVLGGTRIAAS